MGFFSDMLRKASGMPTESEVRRSLNALRDQILSLQGFAIALDEANNSNDDLSLFVCLRLDLLSFSLHIASSDDYLRPSEVNAINAFLGMDMTYEECKAMIERTELSTAEFNSSVPPSFVILAQMAKEVEADAVRFADAMIKTYKNLGYVIASIDGDFDARERRDLDNYIAMLERYVKTF